VNLASGDFHLDTNSPCINSGYYDSFTFTYYLVADLDYNPRIVGGSVDIGAYEFQNPVSRISYAWLQRYGLPINGSTDTSDSDGDGLNNFGEWKAGTSPIDPASSLKILSIGNIDVTNSVIWQSVSGIRYYIQRTMDLNQPFAAIQSNIVGQAGVTSFTDTNAGGLGPWFYRVGVQ
jgi:hypothetical protein